MQKFYYSKDYTGRKHKIPMPEDRGLMLWDFVDMRDVITLILAIGLICLIAWLLI